jgi:hypothetical protein
MLLSLSKEKVFMKNARRNGKMPNEFQHDKK